MDSFPPPRESLPSTSTFTIPKRKGQKDLLTNVDVSSYEAEQLMRDVRQEIFDVDTTITATKISMVHNDALSQDFKEKRQGMKTLGIRTSEQMAASLAFKHIPFYKTAEKVCKDGLITKSQQSSTACLGNPLYGVYLSQYPDLVTRKEQDSSKHGYVIVFTVIKGRLKTLPVGTEDMEPTPEFDGHISALQRGKKGPHLELFDASQMYLYEIDVERYDDLYSPRPRQCLPRALIEYRITKKKSRVSNHALHPQSSLIAQSSTPTYNAMQQQHNMNIPAPAPGLLMPFSNTQSQPITVNSNPRERDPSTEKQIVWDGGFYKSDTLLTNIKIGQYEKKLFKIPCQNVDAITIHHKISFNKLARILPKRIFEIPPCQKLKSQTAKHGFKFIHYEVEPSDPGLRSSALLRRVHDCWRDNECAGVSIWNHGCKMYMIPTSMFSFQLGLSHSPHQYPPLLHCLFMKYEHRSAVEGKEWEEFIKLTRASLNVRLQEIEDLKASKTALDFKRPRDPERRYSKTERHDIFSALEELNGRRKEREKQRQQQELQNQQKRQQLIDDIARISPAIDISLTAPPQNFSNKTTHRSNKSSNIAKLPPPSSSNTVSAATAQASRTEQTTTSTADNTAGSHTTFKTKIQNKSRSISNPIESLTSSTHAVAAAIVTVTALAGSENSCDFQSCHTVKSVDNLPLEDTKKQEKENAIDQSVIVSNAIKTELGPHTNSKKSVETILIDDIDDASPEGNEVQPTQPNQEATPTESKTKASSSIATVGEVAADPEMKAFLLSYGMDIETMESSRYWKQLPLNKPEEIDASTHSIYTQEELLIDESASNSPASSTHAPATTVHQKSEQELLHQQFRKGTAIAFANIQRQHQPQTTMPHQSNGNTSPGSPMLVIDEATTEEDEEAGELTEREEEIQQIKTNKQVVPEPEPLIEDFRISHPRKEESSRRIEYRSSLDSHYRSSKRYGNSRSCEKQTDKSHCSRSRSSSPRRRKSSTRSSRERSPSRFSTKYEYSKSACGSKPKRSSHRGSGSSSSSESSCESSRSRSSKSKSPRPSVDHNFDKAWLDNKDINIKPTTKTKNRNEKSSIKGKSQV